MRQLQQPLHLGWGRGGLSIGPDTGKEEVEEGGVLVARLASTHAKSRVSREIEWNAVEPKLELELELELGPGPRLGLGLVPKEARSRRDVGRSTLAHRAGAGDRPYRDVLDGRVVQEQLAMRVDGVPVDAHGLAVAPRTGERCSSRVRERPRAGRHRAGHSEGGCYDARRPQAQAGGSGGGGGGGDAHRLVHVAPRWCRCGMRSLRTGWVAPGGQ